jgi:hypothetical protein
VAESAAMHRLYAFILGGIAAPRRETLDFSRAVRCPDRRAARTVARAARRYRGTRISSG